MHWLYGTTWGVPLGVVAGETHVKPELLGPAFGLVVWGAALVHQPLLGIADAPWKRSPASLASEALFHVVYGVGAAAALRAFSSTDTDLSGVPTAERRVLAVAAARARRRCSVDCTLSSLPQFVHL